MDLSANRIELMELVGKATGAKKDAAYLAIAKVAITKLSVTLSDSSIERAVDTINNKVIVNWDLMEATIRGILNTQRDFMKDNGESSPILGFGFDVGFINKLSNAISETEYFTKITNLAKIVIK